MALSTTQYGYIIDPMVPFTDDKGKTIKNGFVRVFVAGSSTPVVTYRNFDGAANQGLIELDNSGRTKTSVIGSKGFTYKVCVYDKHHSQESPILTVDKVSVIGANITAGAGSTVVTGLAGLTTKPDGFVDASVVGTDGYVALDHTLVEDDLATDAKVTAVENGRYIPLLNDDVNGPDSKVTLGRLWQWVLGKIKSLSTTITAFRTGDVIPVDGPSGTAKMSKDHLLRVTAQNASGSIHSLSTTATGSDLVAGNYLALDCDSGPKKLDAEVLLNTSTNKAAAFIYPSSGDSNLYVLSDGGKKRVNDLADAENLKLAEVPVARSSTSRKINLIKYKNKCVDGSKIRDGYTINGTLSKTDFSTSGYYASLSVGAKFTDNITSSGYKTGAVDISASNVIYIETSNSSSGRATIITDENGIVLESIEEADCYEGVLLVRGISNWKYLYASVQSNSKNVTIEHGLAKYSTTNYAKRKFGKEDAEKVESGKFVDYQNGRFSTNSSYTPNAVEFMRVSAGASLHLILQRAPVAGDRGVAFYDKNKTYISGTAYSVGTKEYTFKVPKNACFISVTVFGADCIVLLEEYNFSPVSAVGLTDCENGYTPVLTPYIPCVVGKKLNVVVNNAIVEVESQDKVYNLYWEGGDAYDGDVEISPSADSTPNLCVRKTYDSFVYEYPLPIKVCPLNSGIGLTKKVMFIGESTTDNNVVLETLMEDLVGDDLTITLVGTREDSHGNHHEARGGWTTADYMTTESIDGVVNSFYNPVTQHFDIDYYFSTYGVAVPDIIVINFGLNDITRNITSTISNLDYIINSFKSVNPDIVTIVATPNLPTALKMTWGYGSGRREKVLFKDLSLIEEYKDRETDDKIFLCPIHLCLHPVWDMPYVMRDVNSRNNHQVVVAVSPAPTHPSAIGYQKMGDCYYNTIKYVVHKEYD